MRVPDSASRGWSPARLSLTLVVVASCCAQAQSLSESPLLMVETLLNKVPHDSHTPQRVSGYFEVNSTHAGRMWYMFFESRALGESDPLVLWINGGPGCSTALTAFYETGPYRIDDDDLSVTMADYSWDVNHNIIYLDQPIGTGFSYSTDERDTVYDQAAVADNTVAFLAEFLQEHPHMAGRDFVLAGVSYAGHFVPNIAVAVRDAAEAGQLPLRFAGVSLGNPWIAPGVQYAHYGQYAQDAGLVDAELRALIEGQGQPLCQALIDTCLATSSREYCARGASLCSVNTVGVVTRSNVGLSVYDVRRRCEGPLCYDYSALERWLALGGVRSLLGAERSWDGPCARDPHAALMGDWLFSYDSLLARLLEDGLPVLVYAGVHDLLCNWRGQEAWIEAMDWAGAGEFARAPYREWLADGRVAGRIRSSGGLSFVLLDEAGHYAPYDVPAEVWHLFSRFARGLDVADDRDNASYVPADPLVLQPSLRAGGAPRVRIADSALQAAGDGVGVPGPSGTVSLTGRRRRRRLQR